MSITNYFFIGIIWTFLVDLLLDKYKNHPRIIKLKWGWIERIVCVLFWPIVLFVFSKSFLKTLK